MTDATRPDALEGVAWHLTRGILIPPDTTITARFVDGTVAGHAGVNRYRAEYVIDGHGLRIGPAATTRMAGPPDAAAAEGAFLTLLEATAGFRLGDEGRTLGLTDAVGDETLGFAAAPKVAEAIVGRWDVRFVRRDSALVSPSAGTSPWLEFDAAGRVAGHAAVNRVHGSARVDGDRLFLGPLASTRMAGPPEAMDDEAALLEALEQVTALRLDGDDLELLDADGETRVQLVRAAEAG